jgi:uncharacterized protein (TIGR02246 family)
MPPGFLAAHLLIVLAAGAPAADAAASKSCPRADPADLAAVKRLPADYIAAWRGPNAEREVMRLFAPDAVILPHHRVRPSRGHEEIRGFWWPKAAAPFTIEEFTMEVREARVCGDVAYAWGDQSLRWSSESSGKRTVTSNAGTFLMVLRRAPGGWLFDALMWDDPPNRVQ